MVFFLGDLAVAGCIFYYVRVIEKRNKLLSEQNNLMKEQNALIRGQNKKLSDSFLGLYSAMHEGLSKVGAELDNEADASTTSSKAQ